MKPIHFKESNKILSPPQDMKEECENLSVFHDGSLSISCWRPSFRERIKILFKGKLWLGIYFKETQPPVWLNCNYPFLK